LVFFFDFVNSLFNRFITDYCESKRVM